MGRGFGVQKPGFFNFAGGNADVDYFGGVSVVAESLDASSEMRCVGSTVVRGEGVVFVEEDWFLKRFSFIFVGFGEVNFSVGLLGLDSGLYVLEEPRPRVFLPRVGVPRGEPLPLGFHRGW